jgi:hypothetical protein
MLQIGMASAIATFVDENDPTNIKLISEMTLTNPRFYHPVEPTDAARY